MRLVLGNIVEMKTDAVASAARSDLQPAPGISEAVFSAADTAKLKAECRRIGRCRIGQAVVTSSCGLPCRYIIHVVGPDWYSGHKSDRLLVADCYLRALDKALEYRCKSVALPLMFSGDYHIPRLEALQIAGGVIRKFEKEYPELEISLVLYRESIYRLACKVLEKSGTE